MACTALPEVVLDQRDLEQACALTETVVAATGDLRSYLVLRRLETLRQRFGAFRAVPVVGTTYAMLDRCSSPGARMDIAESLHATVNAVTDTQPLYQRDPNAYRAYLAEGNARQARKRVGAVALVLDRHGRILLVDPAYKPAWDLPGGMAEEAEAPDDAVRRELGEELGRHEGLGLWDGELRLLVVDWVAPHGPWGDSMILRA